jgi:hypothetical protein
VPRRRDTKLTSIRFEDNAGAKHRRLRGTPNSSFRKRGQQAPGGLPGSHLGLLAIWQVNSVPTVGQAIRSSPFGDNT